MKSILDYYKNNINKFSIKINSLKKSADLLSFLRLISFILFGFSLYFVATDKFGAQKIMILFTIIFLILFALFVSLHLKIIKKKDFTEKLLKINKNEKNIINGKLSILNDGTAYANPDNYSIDLDIFGKGSLFQLINRCGTAFGMNKLVEELQNTSQNINDIKEKQASVKEFSSKKELRQLILANLINDKDSKEDSVKSLFEYKSQFIGGFFWDIIAWVWPFLFIPLTIYSYYLNFWGIWTVLFFFSWGIVGWKLKKINFLHNLTTKKSGYLKNYSKVFKLIHDEKFSSTQLLHLQDKLKDAHLAFVKLNTLVNRFDYRLNKIVGLLLNSFLLYDIHNSIAVEKWIEKNKEKMKEWFDALGSLEAMNSLATFHFIELGVLSI